MIQNDILLKFFVYVIFSIARFLIIFISLSVNLDCFSVSGSVNESNNIIDRSCLTSSNIVAKKASLYLLKILSIIDSS